MNGSLSVHTLIAGRSVATSGILCNVEVFLVHAASRKSQDDSMASSPAPSSSGSLLTSPNAAPWMVVNLFDSVTTGLFPLSEVREQAASFATPSSSHEPDPILGWVNGHEIRESDSVTAHTAVSDGRASIGVLTNAQLTIVTSFPRGHAQSKASSLCIEVRRSSYLLSP